MSQQPQGRGRGRGRARGAVQPGPQGTGAVPRPGPAQPPAPQGAWAARPQQQQQQRQQQPQQRQQQPQQQRQQQPQQQQQPPQAQWVRPSTSGAQQPAGRGTRPPVSGGGEASSAPVKQQFAPQNIGEAENTPPAASGGRRGAGNGGVRGRPNRNEIYSTKPTNCETKQGSSGQRITLLTNYFTIKSGQWNLNQYRVDFNPETDVMPLRKSLLREACKGFLNGYLFDGTVLYTPQTINPDPVEKFVKDPNDQNIRITIRRVGDLAWGDYHYIQLFNIIIRKCLQYMKFHLIQRNYFDPTAKIDLRDYQLEIWPGYYTSMRQHERSILMTTDIQFKIMRTDNVYDLLMECRLGRKEFMDKIIGSVVLTFYNNKTYKIDDVEYGLNPTNTFPLKDGGAISYIQYYKKKYNVNIRCETQPLLVSRSKPREIRAGMPDTVYLIPELCQLTGLTDRQRENFQLMTSLAKHTRVNPKGRIQKLMEFSQRMVSNKEVMAELNKWDLSVGRNLLEIQARTLNPETICGGANERYSAGANADWTRELRSLPMLLHGNMQSLVVITPGKFRKSLEEFMLMLRRAANGMRWTLGQHRTMEINDDRAGTYLDALEKAITVNPSLIIVVLSNQNSDRYSAIKKKCCVDRGIPSQVILAKNLSSKGAMSIATKVAIQLNCKVGGAPWSVLLPLTGLMVVGYDVCRDTMNKGRSFAGMVASLDKNCTRYFNYACDHKAEEELSKNFANFMLLALVKYREHNGGYPERIIIYRDGVGDGQIPFVRENEVESIRKRLTDEIYKDKPLRMCFVIVSKRINTRFFYKEENPPPGTVVDDHITLPERYDFFIVSQCVRQGTVSPTSYNVIYDTFGLSPDKLQMLTYKLCHMYFNWSGTVRVPAPCQYAHKLAFLVAKFLHRPAHRQLENVLFYL